MIFYLLISAVIGIFVGIFTVESYWFPVVSVCALITVIFYYIFSRKLLLPICLLCVLMGMQYFSLKAHQLTAWQLSGNQIKQPMLITGQVVSIPRPMPHGVSFLFRAQALFKISWYGSHANMHVGDRWRFAVSLKPPMGFHNPGGFDYKKWLIVHGIRATGYVKNYPTPMRLSSSNFKYQMINRYRASLQKLIQQSITNPNISGLIAALATGSHDYIQSSQWPIFQRTGTNHIIAIAGLHIGIVAGIGFFLFGWLWRRSEYLMLWQPVPYAKAIGGIIFAIIYAMLAGFTLPTQRAVLMIIVLMLSICYQREVAFWQRFVFAFCLVVILDPFSVYSETIWMSFGSVFWIVYACHHTQQSHGKFYQWWRLQLGLLIGLTPLTLFYFHQVSIVGFLANAIAVPWVAFIIIPLCLSAVFMNLFGVSICVFIFKVAGWCMTPLWYYLSWLSAYRWSMWTHVIPRMWILWFALLGGLFFLSPYQWLPKKLNYLLGLLCWVPLFFYRLPGPKAHEVWLTFLDVGHAVAIVIQTQHHHLLYEAGLKNYVRSEVVLPYLEYLGLDGTKTMSNMPSCYPERYWEWNGISFRVLSHSCELLISNGSSHVLLTGDIKHPKALPADVLLVPRYGSKTSSNGQFVQTVHPHVVVFSTEKYNRYRFPSPVVVSRYQKIHAKLYSTADNGAIFIHINDKSSVQVNVMRH